METAVGQLVTRETDFIDNTSAYSFAVNKRILCRRLHVTVSSRMHATICHTGDAALYATFKPNTIVRITINIYS